MVEHEIVPISIPGFLMTYALFKKGATAAGFLRAIAVDSPISRTWRSEFPPGLGTKLNS